jgi:signal transduction histidine kinase
MSPRQRLLGTAAKPQLPRRTVRLRLTVLYGALFLVSGAALLGFTYLLVDHTHSRNLVTIRGRGAPGQATHFLYGFGATSPPSPPPGTPESLLARTKELRAQADRQRASELSTLLVDSGIALGIMTILSVLLGWLVAGRVLAPLRTMTATTRRISERSLHQRLALEGPDDELKELGDTIDGLLERLEAAFDAQRRFVANASHELRTPLTVMRTSLDVAAAKPGPVQPQVMVLTDKLREGLDQADRLLESFLILARAQHGTLPDQSEVSLTKAVSGAIAARAGAIEDKGLDVRVDIDELRVRGSETLLARMIGNLIDNAVRHNERSGWVRVSGTAQNGTVRVVIESGGERLDEEKVRELAAPFRRLAADRTSSADGFGLGLSIVAAIAAAHGGSVELHALREGGLQVIISLPRRGVALGERDAAATPGAAVGEPGAAVETAGGSRGTAEPEVPA